MSYGSEEWLFPQDKTSSLSMKFYERVAFAQHCSIRRFIKWLGLVHQMGTNILQQDPRELEDIEAAYMEMVCPMVTRPSMDKNQIINLHQLPIPFTFDRQKTVTRISKLGVEVQHIPGGCTFSLCMSE